MFVVNLLLIIQAALVIHGGGPGAGGESLPIQKPRNTREHFIAKKLIICDIFYENLLIIKGKPTDKF
jgi:hypothetical protein